jgi:hypothetical protein
LANLFTATRDPLQVGKNGGTRESVGEPSAARATESAINAMATALVDVTTIHVQQCLNNQLLWDT